MILWKGYGYIWGTILYITPPYTDIGFSLLRDQILEESAYRGKAVDSPTSTVVGLTDIEMKDLPDSTVSGFVQESPTVTKYKENLIDSPSVNSMAGYIQD